MDEDEGQAGSENAFTFEAKCPSCGSTVKIVGTDLLGEVVTRGSKSWWYR